MFRFKKLILMALAVVIVVSMSTSASASETDETLINEIVQYVYIVNEQMGITMSDKEISILEKMIEDCAHQYQIKKNISLSEAYSMYLTEIKEEVPLISMRSSGGGTANTKLPTAAKGYIFFTDNSMPYNHVGLYTETDKIIESMPDSGVQHVSITSDDSLQDTVGGDNDDSCIMSLSGVTYAQRTAAVDWAIQREFKPYDVDFINNKTDYYMVNYIIHEEDDAYNCSELVWKAYERTANIDLDSNGGFAVYPNNIFKSSITNYYKGF